MNIFIRICALLADVFASFYIGLCVILILYFPPMAICLCFYGVIINYKMILTFYTVLALYTLLSWRKTFGKRIFRLETVDRDTHSPASYLQIIKRNLIFLLTLGLSYLWLIPSKGKYTLHDKLSKTTVIFDKKIEK